MKLDAKVCAALESVKRASSLMDEGKHGEALEPLLEVRKLKLRGSTSGYVCYLIAVCYDLTEDVIMASRFIEEALALDPLCTAFNSSFGIINDHVRRVLADPDRSPEDKSTPKLYEILMRNGETDTESHLAMARFLAHKKDLPAALRIVCAVNVLDSTCRKAWLLTRDLAREAGEAELQAQAEAELALLVEDGQVMFAMPGTAQG